MQILTGTKREITLREWQEILEKAEKRLSESEECYRRFCDEDSKQWIAEGRAKVEKIKSDIKEVTAYMDLHNIH